MTLKDSGKRQFLNEQSTLPDTLSGKRHGTELKFVLDNRHQIEGGKKKEGYELSGKSGLEERLLCMRMGTKCEDFLITC